MKHTLVEIQCRPYSREISLIRSSSRRRSAHPIMSRTVFLVCKSPSSLHRRDHDLGEVSSIHRYGFVDISATHRRGLNNTFFDSSPFRRYFAAASRTLSSAKSRPRRPSYSRRLLTDDSPPPRHRIAALVKCRLWAGRAPLKCRLGSMGEAYG